MDVHPASFTAERTMPDADTFNRVDGATSEAAGEAARRAWPPVGSDMFNRVDGATNEAAGEASRRAWPPVGSDDVLWTSWSSRCETPVGSLVQTPSEPSVPPAATQQDSLEADAAQRLLRIHPQRDLFPKIAPDDQRLFPTAHSHDPMSASSLPASLRRPIPVGPEARVNAPHTEALQAMQQRKQEDQGG